MAEKLAELFGNAEPSPPSPTPVPELMVQAPPVVAAPAPEPHTPAEAKVEAKVEAIPHPTALEWRDRMKIAEKRIADFEAQQRQKPQTVPSVHDDPEAFAAHIQEATNRAVVSERFNISETLATEKHGEEAVKAAMEWGMTRSQESPGFAAEYMKQRNPIDWAVRQHKREKIQNDIGDDVDAYVRKRAAELGLAIAPAPTNAARPAAAPQPVAPPRPATPSPSLASAPSAGSMQTPVYQQPKELDRLFGKE